MAPKGDKWYLMAEDSDSVLRGALSGVIRKDVPFLGNNIKPA
jgi:hypothetical protein